jgi:hypothetical protein
VRRGFCSSGSARHRPCDCYATGPRAEGGLAFGDLRHDGDRGSRVPSWCCPGHVSTASLAWLPLSERGRPSRQFRPPDRCPKAWESPMSSGVRAAERNRVSGAAKFGGGARRSHLRFRACEPCDRVGDNAITRLGVFLADSRAHVTAAQTDTMPMQRFSASACRGPGPDALGSGAIALVRRRRSRTGAGRLLRRRRTRSGQLGGRANAIVRETRAAKLAELFSRATASSAEHRDHLGREPFELLRVVDERVEQNQLRTGVRHGTDAGGALLGRAREDVF